MKKLLPFTVCLLPLLGACGERPIERIELTCDQTNINARVYRDRVQARISDETFDGDVTLKRSESASGARYMGTSDDTLFVLWNKGEAWLLLTISGDLEDVSICTRTK
jgi:membrane-bound inhibitor of C-type lysozyme